MVSVLGDLDLAALPRLTEELGHLRDTGKVTLDLEGVDYLDPVCLGALLAAELRTRRAGGSLDVLAGPEVRRLLRETRLDEIIEVRAAGEGPRRCET